MKDLRASKKICRSSTARSAPFADVEPRNPRADATPVRGSFAGARRTVAATCSRMEKRHSERRRERMIPRSSFIPSCRERALQRNRCQSQYEESPRLGRGSKAWSLHWLPRLCCHSRAQIFQFLSSYSYLPYLFIFLPFRA